VQLRCNWKVYIDAFQEAYHVGLVHAESLAYFANQPEVFVPTSFRTYGPHRSLSAWADPSYPPSPAEMIAWKHGTSLVSERDGVVKPPAGINPSKDENWWFDINVCFPNFFVDVGTGWYFTYNFFPVSENETFWEVNMYYQRPKTPGQRCAEEHMKVILRDALYEDLSTMEGVQRGLESGALKGILPGGFEMPIRHQYWAVEQWINAK
jgi:phenylpropionate dioxygenase-like ring-hydroxylating dioxygenase large terminal subunit